MAAILAAFVSSLFFRGIGVNLIVLVATSGALLGALTLVGPARIVEAACRNRGASIAVGAAILVLVLNYEWSLSKDSTFAATWVLAALPLTLLVSSALDRNTRHRLPRAIVVLVAGLALVSLVRFVAYGERAHLPLIDPNNYATLMYLCWIPAVHGFLARAWSNAPSSTLRRAAEVSLSFLLLVALFATHSRTGTLVVVVAFVVWASIAVARRLTLSGTLAHLAAAAAAQAVVLISTPADFVSSRVASLGGGVSVRLDLIDAAWRMFLDHPTTGVGVLCFNLLYGAYRPISEQTTAGLFVHNDYVQLLAEGGMALAVLPVVLGAFAVVRLVQGLRHRDYGPRFVVAGYALAIGAACAHALVNFVFFSLPLCIVLGLLAALALGERPGSEVKAAGPLPIWSARTALAFGYVCFSFLLVDLMTLGVLQGQRGVPFAAMIRDDADKQLEYAGFARSVNTNRGLPVLSEAILLAMKSEAPGASPYLKVRVLADFREAAEVDPFNPLVYVAFSDFVASHGESLPLKAGETREELLIHGARPGSPVNVAVIDRLLELYSIPGAWATGMRC